MKKLKVPKSKPLLVKEPEVMYQTKKTAAGLEAHIILEVERSRVAGPLNRVDTFRKGLRKKSFEKLKEVTGLDYNALALAFFVSTKTLQRKQVFDVVQSEKMYELAELYSLGINYFGEAGFRRWMERPLFSIGNRIPMELIDVSEGISLLKTEIMRLQYGIAV